MFGPGGSFFVWVRGMGGGTNGQSASGAAAGAEFFLWCVGRWCGIGAALDVGGVSFFGGCREGIGDRGCFG